MTRDDQRLLIVRKNVHDKLMEMKGYFEKRLGEEISFNAFLLQMLEEFERLDQAVGDKDNPNKPVRLRRLYDALDGIKVIGITPVPTVTPVTPAPGVVPGVTWTDPDTVNVTWTGGSGGSYRCPSCGHMCDTVPCPNCGSCGFLSGSSP